MAVAVADLAERTVTLGDVLGRDAEELGDRILTRDSTAARLDELDAFLTRRFHAAAEADPAMAQVMAKLRRTTVSSTAADLGWSRKRLAAWFGDRTGIRPAQFSRLSRFERFADQLQRAPRASLADLAYEAGYADQAHLTPDVRRLTGMTPAALRDRLLPAGGGVRN